MKSVFPQYTNLYIYTLSVFTCTAQFNSMWTATCSLRLVKMTGKGLFRALRCSIKVYLTTRLFNNNNNNSYIALYPVKIYKLTALYIINIKIRLTINKNNKKV